MSQAPLRSAPSLVLRLVFSAGIALAVALALIGLAVDRGFRSAAEGALEERLAATVFLLLATIDLDEAGRPLVSEALAEPRLDQPGSGLYAGALTPMGGWTSASHYGLIEAPRARLLERGETLFRGPEAEGNYYVYAVGLGWEQPDGEIIDLTLWSAENPDRFATEVTAFRADLWRWLILAAILVVSAQLVLLVLFLRPLRQVAQEVRDIEAGERQNLSGNYPRELQPLTANLNALLATERDNATHYRQALADLAHALKTPLAVMRTRLESTDEVPASAQIEELERMNQLIRRQLERAARSTRRTLNQPVAVMPIAQRLADSLERLYKEPPVVIEVVGDPELAARVDERDLMELIGNLMDNAAKYGRGQMRVAVESGQAGARQSGVEVLIEDNGRGIDPEAWSKLVQRGVRGDERREGQGLGLAIAEQLMAAYGGELVLEPSPSLGGTAIRLVFPPR
ncbi:MAG: ATP-binding protein [Wenzhouxiangella sp.]